MSPANSKRTGSLGGLLLGSALQPLLALSCVFIDGIERDHRRAVGQMLGPQATHLDQVVDAVTSHPQPPGSVRLCRTFTHLGHSWAYNKTKSQS